MKLNNKLLIMLNPQWQGGADTVTYHGAKELERFYLQNAEYIEMPVKLTTDLPTENKIAGYADIYAQMKRAYSELAKNNFRGIFSVGGGCDADVPVIAYLNKKYGGKLTVLWLDAHGDLNSPQESQTGLFYGMPARTLLGGSGLFTDIVERPLTARQFIHIGGRDFDAPELQYMQENNIRRFACASLNEIRNALQENPNDFVYVHLDLDALNPNEFPNTPLPVAGGLSKNEVLSLLGEIKEKSAFAGLGLYEYAPCGERIAFIQAIFDMMLL